MDLNLKRVGVVGHQSRRKGWGGLLPRFCSEPSGKAATYVEPGKVGREGPCVAEGEGGGTEEEVGRCEAEPRRQEPKATEGSENHGKK